MVSIYKTLGKFICWVFQYNVCWKNLWKFFYWSIIFKIRLNGCLSHGATSPISFWAQIYILLAVIHLFDITYLPKSFNHSEKPCKMINYGPRAQRLRNTAGTFYNRHDGVYRY